MPWTLFDTALGPCGIAWSDDGILAVQLPESSREATAERLVARATGAGARATARTTPPWVKGAIDLACAHLGGEPQNLRGPALDLRGITPFTAKVYEALKEVPAGATVTYGELARRAGSTDARAARAVGRAMATNPVPLFVPCHRVLAAAGKPGGFSAYGGVVTKERILRLEGWNPPAAESPLFAASADDRLPYDAAAARDHLTAADPRLGAHLVAVGDFTLSLKKTEGVFAALAESIVYQQLNGKAAATIFARVRALFPRGRLEPRALLALPDDDLRRAGLSRSKLAALRDLAGRTAASGIPTLAQLRKMDDDAIVEALTQVRGIGRWTVEMLLIFRLGRPDVLPLGDYGVRKGFARVFHRGQQKDALPTPADLAKRGERWRPFRSVASWYLWRALDAD